MNKFVSCYLIIFMDKSNMHKKIKELFFKAFEAYRYSCVHAEGQTITKLFEFSTPSVKKPLLQRKE